MSDNAVQPNELDAGVTACLACCGLGKRIRLNPNPIAYVMDGPYLTWVECEACGGRKVIPVPFRTARTLT